MKPSYSKSKPMVSSVPTQRKSSASSPSPQTIKAVTPDVSPLVKFYREAKSWAFAFMAAGSLVTLGGTYLPQPTKPAIDKRCELALELHKDYRAKAPTSIADVALSREADKDLEDCIK